MRRLSEDGIVRMYFAHPKPDPSGSRERQLFEKLFLEQDRVLEPPDLPPEVPNSENPCLSRYPRDWVGPDRQCTLDLGHVEAGNPVHQHLNLYFWHERALKTG